MTVAGGSATAEPKLRNALRSVLKGLNGRSLVLLFSAAVALGMFAFTLLSRQEIGGETWGYWFFARVFAESGDFIAADRSPLYTLYLNGFRWLGYPTSVTVERLATGLIMMSGIVLMFRSFMGLGLAVFAALLWIPFLQFTEPPVQQLALAFSLMGLVVRRSTDGRNGLGASYALFLMAYMFRGSYVVLILLFIGWDLYRIYRTQRHGLWSRLRQTILSSRFIAFSVVPLLLVVSLMVWFSVRESDHPWSNAFFSTTSWFPIGDSRSLGDAHFIQAWNWAYVEQEYGTFEGKDWYFTNEELFDGADNMLDAVRANPSFVFELMVANIKPTITSVAKFTEISYLPFLREWDILLLGIILVALWAAAKDADLRLFIAASLVMVAVSASPIPGPRRHLVALVPLLILSAYWYGNLLRGLVDLKSQRLRNQILWAGILGIGFSLLYYALRAAFAPQPGARTLYAVLVGLGASLPLISIGIYRPGGVFDKVRQRFWFGSFVMFVPLVLFSSGLSKWTALAGDAIQDFRQGTVRVLENRGSLSMKASFEELHSIVQGCSGVLSWEHTFAAAFLDVPLNGVYDIMEIPPFGRLGESDYDGLRPDRVDCVLVSDRLATAIGHGTDIKIRYDGYIKPYVEQLKEMGADVYDVDRYGQVVVLKNKE
jgi:hypothetical protein